MTNNKEEVLGGGAVRAQEFKIVDLFAGPGGLGEGLTSASPSRFRIAVSAEKDAIAHRTLTLRAFFRMLREEAPDSIKLYYEYCEGQRKAPFDEKTEELWRKATNEALRLELGKLEDNLRLDQRISEIGLDQELPWVLIGGPPCQAYSLVGRSRNKAKTGYSLEKDSRSYLYREYLRVIQKYRPWVFVMENVKGLLSAKHGEEPVFHKILRDLADPDSALEEAAKGHGYKIYSLTTESVFVKGQPLERFNAKDFIIRAEQYGIPQARHRVILLGVRDDIMVRPSRLTPKREKSKVYDAIGDLPKVRSRLTKQKDSHQAWSEVVREHIRQLREAAVTSEKYADLAIVLQRCLEQIDQATILDELALGQTRSANAEELASWYLDPCVASPFHHDPRGHMASDLRRYVYSAAFAQAFKRSPKGHLEFTLVPELKPDHENWETGKFADRFKVQLPNVPAKTITSHISKDGHAFIHYDPLQCRSLTVREAARIQTFPDNYFFEGERTAQFHQVGNAVPPLLAKQIGQIVLDLLDRHVAAEELRQATALNT